MMFIAVGLLLLIYFLFSVWFFCNITKGFILDLKANPLKVKLSMIEFLKGMTFFGFLIVAFINPAMAAIGFLGKIFSESVNVDAGNEGGHSKKSAEIPFSDEDFNFIAGPDRNTIG